MNATRPKSLAEQEAEAGKHSVLLKYAYHTTPTKGMMLPKEYRHVQPELLAIFQALVESAGKYKQITGRHLRILGVLGELFAEIMFCLQRHAPMTKGSDGKLRNDLVEVKTITSDKKNDTVQVKRAGDFEKLAVVKISDDFQFSARMVDRKTLEEHDETYLKISWDDMIAGEPHPEMHRQYPIKKAPLKEIG